MRTFLRYLLTAAIVLVAIALIAWRYYDYIVNPWTRDGQVMANVIQVAPRVSGPVVELPIIDNQRVKAGDLLFRIDPRTYQTDLALAEAKVDYTKKNLLALDKQVAAAQAAVDQSTSEISQARSQVTADTSTLVETEKARTRAESLLETDDVSQAYYDSALRNYQVAQAAKEQADAALLGAESRERQAEAQLAQAQANRGLPGPDNAQLRQAMAELETARLNLGFTEVRASVDGMISNLNVRLGSQAVANQPFMALIDEKSFWIAAYFRETMISRVSIGDPAVITLMGNPDSPFSGHVDSIGWGISVSDGSTGFNLLPNVSPTFQWIRLAQRIPVRVLIDDLPDGVVLRVGQTTSVMIETGERKGEGQRPVPAPTLLQ